MKEIPWFPCSEPDLALTIKVEEDPAGKKYRPDGMLMTIIPKPRRIWSEGEDYVCQIKYDGVRCLIAWNDDYTATTSFSAESPRPTYHGKVDTGCLNWEDKKLKEYLTSQIIPKEKDFMDDLLAGIVTEEFGSTTTPVESPLKYVSRKDKTRNRVNLETYHRIYSK